MLFTVCRMHSPGNSFGLLGKSLGIPVVTSIHTDIQTLARKIKAPTLSRIIANWKEVSDSKLLDGCATTSSSFQAQLAAQGTLCDHVIPTAVDVQTFCPGAASAEIRHRLTWGLGERALLAVFAGRLAPEKRLDLALRLLERCYCAILLLLGHGLSSNSEHILVSQDQRLRRSQGYHRVYCVPGFAPHAELAAVYASADAHVSFSTFETLGNTVLEAHAAGCPVVVPRAQGFRDTVRHGEDGFLFDAGPGVPEEAQVAEAAAFLGRLARDPALGRALGEAGRRKVQGHTRELVVKDVLGWYQRSIDRRKEKTGRALFLWHYLSLVYWVITSIFFCHLCIKTFPLLLFLKNHYLAGKRRVVGKYYALRGIKKVTSQYSFEEQ
ncbi:unnamed protein product [Heterosigma akashiwo]